MEKKMKVSVLMLTYNHEDYIEEAIRSVMLQKTSFPFELIIGNDCSTDNTGSICEAWKEKYPDRIVLLNRKENIGFQRNFIHSYEQCNGEYIAICEGDDFWTDKYKLQKQIDFLETHTSYSVCFHRVINYYTASKTKSLSNGKQKTHTTINDLALSNYITNVSVVFRNGLFGELPDWFAEVSTYDYALHMLNAQYGDIYYMKKPMAVYRQHGKAIWSTTTMDNKLKISLKIRELLMEYFKTQKEVYDALLTATTRILFALYRYYQSTNNPGGLEEIEKKILKYHPDWNPLIISEQIKDNPVGSQSSLFKVLKSGRAFVSWFLPLPRIR